MSLIDDLIVVAILSILLLGYALLCEAAIERIAKSINKMRRRKL